MLIFIDKASWMRQFQLVQERQDRIVLRAVAGFSPSPQALALVTEPIGTLLGPAVEFRLDLVPEIRPGPSGKSQVYRSLTKADDPSTVRE